VGFLDRAKQLAEQARSKAEEALADVKARMPSTPSASGAPAAGPRMGTPYVPGMFGRPGWREKRLPDPAAVLPVADRERAGLPHSTKSQIVDEPFGMGRRWTSGGRSVGFFYQIYGDQKAWEPPYGATPMASVPDAWTASLDDGRSLVFLRSGHTSAVVELRGLDEAAPDLIRAVLTQLRSG
jgi:hypothetical protein